jgi:hypothetical protein
MTVPTSLADITALWVIFSLTSRGRSVKSCLSRCYSLSLSVTASAEACKWREGWTMNASHLFLSITPCLSFGTQGIRSMLAHQGQMQSCVKCSERITACVQHNQSHYIKHVKNNILCACFPSGLIDVTSQSPHSTLLISLMSVLCWTLGWLL